MYVENICNAALIILNSKMEYISFSTTHQILNNHICDRYEIIRYLRSHLGLIQLYHSRLSPSYIFGFIHLLTSRLRVHSFTYMTSSSSRAFSSFTYIHHVFGFLRLWVHSPTYICLRFLMFSGSFIYTHYVFEFKYTELRSQVLVTISKCRTYKIVDDYTL